MLIVLMRECLRDARAGVGELVRLAMKPAAAVPCAVVWVQCGTDSLVSLPEQSELTVDVIAPDRVKDGDHLPIVVRAIQPDGTIDTRVDRTTRVVIGESSEPIVLKKGIGAITPRVVTAADVPVALVRGRELLTVRHVFDTPTERYAGSLASGSESWDSISDRYVEETLVIPEDTDLVIHGGTRIEMGDRANIVVQGHLRAVGTRERPIVFISADWERPWGGVEIDNGSAVLAHCFFVNGGADPERIFGHSGSQAVLMARSAVVDLSNCYFLDNPGKALGADNSRVTVESTLITRCDTGGEFHASVARVSSTHVLDIPNGDNRFVDDDNDGFYFATTLPGSDEPSVVESTFIVTGKDDAIDHNNANLEIRNCWLQGYLHEGVAGSNGNYVRVFNTMVTGCEQGVEAGYGEPLVLVDHSVIVNNGVGLRFGDSYDWGSGGRMIVTNSVIYDNRDDVRNYDLQSAGPIDGGITVTHSVVDDVDVADAPSVQSASPRFDVDYRLLPDSPGKGAASDGTDIGLLGLD